AARPTIKKPHLRISTGALYAAGRLDEISLNPGRRRSMKTRRWTRPLRGTEQSEPEGTGSKMALVEVTAMLAMCSALSFLAFICRPIEPETADLDAVDHSRG
ncbi:MAG: hypothetical protein RLZZ01_1882, partial [Actinomycetota bacterium]